MTKTSKKQLKNDEQRVIEILKKNSNESINDISKKCGFSRQKVWRIIKQLEKSNTIWGYTAVIDDEKQGLKSYIVLIKRSNKPLTKELIDTITSRQIDKTAKKMDVYIQSSIYLNGFYDWIICINTDELKKAKSFVELLNNILSGYLIDVKLIEKIFPAKLCGIENPEIEKLNDFFINL